MLTLCYRQDVVDAFVRSIDSWKAGAPSGYRDIEPVFTISVGDLARKIAHIANLNEGANPSFDTASLDNRLYKVYQSYKENEIA